MAVNGASTINIKVRETLKNITVGKILSGGKNVLFALPMIFAATRFSEFFCTESETLDDQPETDATDRCEKNSTRKLKFLAFLGAAALC